MTNVNEKEIVDKLKSTETSEIYNALVKFSKNYVHNQDKMKTLQENSVIKLIVPFMEHPKFCNISLSIIADGCRELNFTNEVVKCDGHKALMRIMKSFVNDDIKNKACCALENIVKIDVGFKAVLLTKPVSNIVNFLSETMDVNCQQTAVRTLMILGTCLKARNEIVQENGHVYIVKLLRSSNVQLVICCVQALANLTEKCSLSCAQQLLEFEFHKILIELNLHSERAIRKHALLSLKNLCSLEEIRSRLINVGAVKLLTDVLSAYESHEMSRHAALALCLCLDHIHVWNHNGTDRSLGLKALFEVLKNEYLRDIHVPVLSALTPLSYEFNGAVNLVNLGVLQILIQMLNKFVKNYECKHMCHYFDAHIRYKDPFSSRYQLITESGLHYFNKACCQNLSECDLTNINTNFDIFKDHKKSVPPKKSPNIKDMHIWDTSIYGTSSVTSDYSGSCSPVGQCSPSQRYPSEFNCVDVGSPSTGHTSSGAWSPASLIDECIPYNVNYYWSPAVSTCSNSSVRENGENESIVNDDFICFKNNVEILDETIHENQLEISISNNLSFKSDTTKDIKTVPKLIGKTNFSVNTQPILSCKKFKTEHLYAYDPLRVQCQTPAEINMKTSETIVINKESKALDVYSDIIDSLIANRSVVHDNDNTPNLKALSKENERHFIDHYVILFILKISFHIGENNFHMDENSFFSVLIDYICLVHNPTVTARKVLLNLIKNRYSLENLILNGFFSELELKMSNSNLPCCNHKDLHPWYACLKKVIVKEIESDFGIGVLGHVLTTSDRKGQFHAICASKFVANKSSLYKFLIEANGLSLMLDFLFDPDDIIRMRTVLSMVTIYRVLYMLKKVSDTCCFGKSCVLEISNCFYKQSPLNITFIVAGGAKLLANREKICENSDYFRALLQGHFQESSSEVVVLRDISAENLSAIFHFLHGCGNGSYCPYITRIPVSVLIELLSDCDRFLLMKIKEFVEDRLCHSDISSSNVSKIYKQSKLHNSPALAKRILTETLRLSPQKVSTWDTFKELLDVGSSVNLYSDIEELFKNSLLESS